MRDAFFASPQFPRILSPDVSKDTITRGVANGLLAYVGKNAKGEYKPFCFNQALMTADIEFSDEMLLITKETAEAYLKSRTTPPVAPVVVPPSDPAGRPVTPVGPSPTAQPPLVPTNAATLRWSGEVPHQKWMTFFTKVLSKFASARGLKLTVKFEVSPDGGVSKQKLEETKSALRELGLSDDVNVE